VDGQLFYWHFTTRREFEHQSPQLVVQLAAGGSVLVFDQRDWPDVTPRFVVGVVREAWAAGWQPAVPGRFVLDRSGSPRA